MFISKCPDVIQSIRIHRTHLGTIVHIFFSALFRRRPKTYNTSLWYFTDIVNANMCACVIPVYVYVLDNVLIVYVHINEPINQKSHLK